MVKLEREKLSSGYEMTRWILGDTNTPLRLFSSNFCCYCNNSTLNKPHSRSWIRPACSNLCNTFLMTLYLYMDVSGCAATCTSAGAGFPLTLGLLLCVNCCVAEFSAERTETSPSTEGRRSAKATRRRGRNNRG